MSRFQQSRAIKNDAIPYAERVGAQGELQRQSWDGSSATSTDPMGEVRGLSFESYGKVVWSAEESKFAVKTGLKDLSRGHRKCLDLPWRYWSDYGDICRPSGEP